MNPVRRGLRLLCRRAATLPRLNDQIAPSAALATAASLQAAAGRFTKGNMAKPRTVVETKEVDRLPVLDCGGYLETKDGDLCLRLADSVEALRYSGWLITRKWQRPGKQPWDTSIYNKKGNQ